ncbi:uncharacterized protein LOC112348194 [Selaginella moellendorffii]|uniref:uncharacterized protein LOC112348194 n=1 Tax=Selaginella moellendorffii TaxID=88036 RepID=UPI000D1C2DA2|nr:uncharacterized protein LOC112348194 [Selaginella moellendorffii]|eukprot:XP_024536092.1 uncharacterized protein LOC112348194 [Selaginella moellendorffii]
MMITLCIRSGKIASAKDLFDRMPVKTSVAQTALVTSLARKGHLEEAEALFENIKEERDVESWAFGSRCLQTTPTEKQMQATAFEVKRLLIAGKQKEALRAAQDGQLWGCALLMARQLGEKVPCLVVLMYRPLVMVLWFLIVLHRHYSGDGSTSVSTRVSPLDSNSSLCWSTCRSVRREH